MFLIKFEPGPQAAKVKKKIFTGIFLSNLIKNSSNETFQSNWKSELGAYNN